MAKKSKTKNESYSPLKSALIHFTHNKLAMTALFVLIAIFTISMLSPLIAPFDPNEQNLVNIKGDMSPEHWLGTDAGGRDILSRLLYSGCVSMVFGITTTAGILIIGIIVGMISGYYGGKIDTILMRFTEFVMLFPFIPFAIVLNATFSDKIKNPYGSAIILASVIIVLSWVGIARLTRGKVMQEKK